MNLGEILRNPNRLYAEMMKNNPQFKKFVDENKNKPVDQIAEDYKLDIEAISKLLG